VAICRKQHFVTTHFLVSYDSLCCVVREVGTALSNVILISGFKWLIKRTWLITSIHTIHFKCKRHISRVWGGVFKMTKLVTGLYVTILVAL
jgi:hypothetical protein